MRGAPRWTLLVAVLAIAGVACAFTVHRARTPAAFVLQLSDSTLPADGFSSAELKIYSSNGRELTGLEVQAQNPRTAAVESVMVSQRSATALLRAGVLPGGTRVGVSAPGFAPQQIALQ